MGGEWRMFFPPLQLGNKTQVLLLRCGMVLCCASGAHVFLEPSQPPPPPPPPEMPPNNLGAAVSPPFPKQPPNPAVLVQPRLDPNTLQRAGDLAEQQGVDGKASFDPRRQRGASLKTAAAAIVRSPPEQTTAARGLDEAEVAGGAGQGGAPRPTEKRALPTSEVAAVGGGGEATPPTSSSSTVRTSSTRASSGPTNTPMLKPKAPAQGKEPPRSSRSFRAAAVNIIRNNPGNAANQGQTGAFGGA